MGSRMFCVEGKPMITWPVFSGCGFLCTYCNARKAALTRFKHLERYRDGFSPRFIEKELRRRFKPGQFVFICYMGDIAFAGRGEVINILDRVREFPETSFLLMSKHPGMFWYWQLSYPDNLTLGTTIETNRDHGLSKAPPPKVRKQFLAAYDHPHKLLSIEPVLDFDLEELGEWVREIHPSIIYVGADNYRNDLPEPNWEKVEKLLELCREVCPTVVEKPGLERLRR